MKKTVLTYDDVAAAAAMLAGSGADVGVDGVRDLLGSGNRFLIERFLNRWLSEQRRSAPTEPEALPAESASSTSQDLPEGLRRGLEAIWQAVSRHGQEALDAVREETAALSQQVADLESEVEESRQASERRIAGTGTELGRVQEWLQRLDTRLRSETGKRGAGERAAADLHAELQQRLGNLLVGGEEDRQRLGVLTARVEGLTAAVERLGAELAGVKEAATAADRLCRDETLRLADDLKTALERQEALMARLAEVEDVAAGKKGKKR